MHKHARNDTLKLLEPGEVRLRMAQYRALTTIPDGTFMIRFYFIRHPIPQKVALFLEEIGLPYETIPVDTS